VIENAFSGSQDADLVGEFDPIWDGWLLG
jgi:hypothetical protein